MYKNLHETNKLINRLEKYARKNFNGFTIEFKNDKINKVKPSKNKRYSVGCNKMLMEISLKGKKIYLQNFKLLEYNHYIGGWFNKEQKVFQIELILLCDNYIKSINTGKYYKQYSIYDLILQKEIVLRENYIKECKNNNKRLYSMKDKYSIMAEKTLTKKTIRISRNTLLTVYNRNDYLEVNLETGEYYGIDKEE